MKTTWGVVATVKEDLQTIKEFVAHHLLIGASEIHLWFDDPNDPAFDIVSGIPGVIAAKCDDDHWGAERPRTHESRQKRNANCSYQTAQVDWLIHIDADELIHSALPVWKCLQTVGSDVEVVRLRPAESLVNKRRDGVGIFRFALPDTPRGNSLGEKVFGKEYPLLQQGLLGHIVGKFFVRTGRPDMAMSIHGPFKLGRRCNGPDLNQVVLLHLHGRDEERWVSHCQYRLSKGAYKAAFHDERRNAATVDGRGLNAHLKHILDTEGEVGLRAFFGRVNVFDRQKRPLRRIGALLKVRLWLPHKVETVFPGSSDVPTKWIGVDDETGRVKGEIRFLDCDFKLDLVDNYTEISMALGAFEEEEEIEFLKQLVAGRSIDFFDVGGNVGLYSIVVAKHARAESRIQAFEPNPSMIERFRRNLEANSIRNVQIHQVALGDREGEVILNLHGNPGQANILVREAAPEAGITVPLALLSSYAHPVKDTDLKVLKIDIEGAEPNCLALFFSQTEKALWPDYVLFEHVHTDKWEIGVEEIFPENHYQKERVFSNNTLLKKV